MLKLFFFVGLVILFFQLVPGCMGGPNVLAKPVSPPIASTYTEAQLHYSASSQAESTDTLKGEDKEVFPLSYYTPASSEHDFHTDITKPLPSSVFLNQIKNFLEREWISRQNRGYRFTSRSDGFPDMGLLLVEFATFDVKIGGSMTMLEVKHTNDASLSKSKSLFGNEPFDAKLDALVKRHVMTHLLAQFSPSSYIYILLHVKVRVHLVCPTVENAYGIPTAQLRSLVVSASIVPSVFRVFSNVNFFGVKTQFDNTSPKNGVQHDTSFIDSTWTPFMFYGPKPFRSIMEPRTVIDARVIRFISDYQTWKTSNSDLGSVSFPCSEKRLYEMKESSDFLININYCMTHAVKLHASHLALLYLGWVPLKSAVIYYRLISVAQDLVKVHLTQECLPNGWSSPQLWLNIEKAESIYNKCVLRRSGLHSKIRKLLSGVRPIQPL